MSDTPSDQAIGLVRHPVTDEQRRRIAPVVVWKARMATRPHHGWLTTEEARWVDRVAGVLPSDAPEVIYLVARAAIDMGDDPDALHALDLELMLYMAGSARTMTHREWAATGASTEVASARMTPIVRVLGAIGDAVGEVEVPGDSVEALARLSVSTHGESAVNDTRAQEDER